MKRFCLMLWVAVMVCMAAPAFAEEAVVSEVQEVAEAVVQAVGQAAPPAEKAPEAAPAAEEKQAADAAMMEKMKAMTSPNEAHKVLEPMVGKWNFKGKMFSAPGVVAEEMTGTEEAALVYGGRFLKQEIKSTWMGQPFEGLGYVGYDVIRGEYVSVWLDSAATGIMKASGQYDAASQTLKLSGTNSCPMTGEKDRAGRSEVKINDNNNHTYSSYGTGPDGKEYLVMELVYTRAA